MCTWPARLARRGSHAYDPSFAVFGNRQKRVYHSHQGPITTKHIEQAHNIKLPGACGYKTGLASSELARSVPELLLYHETVPELTLTPPFKQKRRPCKNAGSASHRHDFALALQEIEKSWRILLATARRVRVPKRRTTVGLFLILVGAKHSSWTLRASTCKEC